MWFKKASPRRQAIREDVAEVESLGSRGERGVRRGAGAIFLIALVFFVVAAAAQFWPAEPLPYREGSVAPVDLVAPVSFSVEDPERTNERREVARLNSPPVLLADASELTRIGWQLQNLKTDVKDAANVSQLPAEVKERYPGLSDSALAWLRGVDEAAYQKMARDFITRELQYLPLVSKEDGAVLKARNAPELRLAWTDSIEGVAPLSTAATAYTVDQGIDPVAVRRAVAEDFPQVMVPALTSYVMGLKKPTYAYSKTLTAAWAERNAQATPPVGSATFYKGQVIVERNHPITAQEYRALQEADREYVRTLASEHPWALWLSRLGRMAVVLMITAAGALYVSRITRVSVEKKGAGGRQGWAVCGLLLGMLVTAKIVVAIWPQSVYGMGIAPTLLATIILVIAYNQRFALGMAALHALLVTVTLGQGIDFYLPLLGGVAAFSFGLAEIRTRGKLIEVGFVASAGLFCTVWALGLARMAGWGGGGGASSGHGPWNTSMDVQWIEMQSLWAAGSGLFVAMFALAVLPSIERAFHITTAMTLLELCDANKPLLRRLSQEAPGTFNHSLTVGIMAEAAGNAIGANGLLCRVGAYYHDVGKLSKPQYFIENQAPGHPNRHDKLSPAMSLLIIVGHVKDGIELAREYALPWVVHQFIAQHHGTTLVEYFYHAARKRAEKEGSEGPGVVGGTEVSESEFRYPGPKPQTREAAIVMICDGCESAVRAIEEPTAGRIETAVHNMIMKRLMDGQFAQCDLTLRDLGLIEETLIRALAAIHHGRVAYPGDKVPESDVVAQPA